MATTYVSTKAATGVQPRLDVHDDTLFCEFNIATAVATADDGGGGAGGAAFVINDIVQMVKVAAGSTVVGCILGVDALDSSTGVVVAVGDGTTADRFITGSTIGRSAAAGVAFLNNAVGLLYQYTSADTIDFKVTTAASGTASTTGKVRLAVRITAQS